jgi:signal transduction histidine kinase
MTDTQDRVASNPEGEQDSLRRLADEQASLRRVATLVAEGAEPAEIFAAVAMESARILDLEQATVFSFDLHGSVRLLGMSAPQDGLSVGATYPPHPGVIEEVWRTGRPATVEYANVPGEIATRLLASGIRSALGVPITVDGSTWGVVNALSTEGHPLPADAESRLAAFTEIVSTAIANARAADEIRRLAEEQASLRRVATLVAREAVPDEVFAAVAEEVGQLLGVPIVQMSRYGSDRMVTVVGTWGVQPPFTPGSSWPMDGPTLSAKVFETGRPARIDDYTGLAGTIPALVRDAGISSGVGAPIVVNGRLWGVIMGLTTDDAPLPSGIEDRLMGFTELVGTAIANADARADLERLVDEQAALSEVALTVAEGSPPEEVFARVAEQVGRLLNVPAISMVRFEPDGTSTAIAVWGEGNPFGVGATFEPWPGVMSQVRETGRPVRLEDYAYSTGPTTARLQAARIHSGVGVPVIVDGRVWGTTIALATGGASLPEGIEERLAGFTHLVATAIASTQARDDLHRLAEEQAALRRVATLVAEGAPAPEIFAAVAKEVAEVSGLPLVEMARFDPDGWLTVIGSAGDHPLKTGTRWPMDNPTGSAAIQETRESRRIEYSDDLRGTVADAIRTVGVRWAVGVPIVVDGRVWGSIGAAATGEEPPPAEVEARLMAFTEIVATAVSNATANSQLLASRARIVAAGDEARRRIERDLHDGTQQQLVSLGLDLQALKRFIPPEQVPVLAEIQRVQDELNAVTDEVREISRGLHPPLLTQAGLGPALRSLARRAGLPVELDVKIDQRLPESIEIAAYFVVSEGLTNAAKHADASVVHVTAAVDDNRLVLVTADDGQGGALPETGSGLAGLTDRVEALGGRLALTSPRGRGTTISVELPLVPVASDF